MFLHCIFINVQKTTWTQCLKQFSILYAALTFLSEPEDYGNALRSRQAYLDEIRSDQRDEAAAFGDQYKYY